MELGAGDAAGGLDDSTIGGFIERGGAADAVGDGVEVGSRTQDAGFSVEDELGNPANRGGDHQEARRHGLLQGAGEAFFRGEAEHGIGVGEDPPRLGRETMKGDAILEAPVGDELMAAGEVVREEVGIAVEVEAAVESGLGQPPHRLNGLGLPLARLERAGDDEAQGAGPPRLVGGAPAHGALKAEPEELGRGHLARAEAFGPEQIGPAGGDSEDCRTE